MNPQQLQQEILKVQQWLNNEISTSPAGRLGLPRKKQKLHYLVKYIAQKVYSINVKRPCHISHIGFLCKLSKGRSHKWKNRRKRMFQCPYSQCSYIGCILIALRRLSYLKITNATMRLTSAGQRIY